MKEKAFLDRENIMCKGRPISGLGTFRKLLVGQYDLSLLAREKVGRCDDEVGLKTQFMMALHLLLRNLHFIMKTCGLLKF